tara:strand:+ start:1538 stop:2503 length:966 start_codon:yes stop_codon:yes gene_type:complete
MRNLSYLEAIKEGISQSMVSDKNVIIYGEGSDPAIGSFHKKFEFAKKFGSDRVFDTPLSEALMQGVGIGASLNGLKPIMVWFRMDFMLLGMDQIINHASKFKYIYNLNCPIVMKTTVGRGWGQGPVHSQAFHNVFSHFPGLKVVLPSNPYDAKGLMLSAIKDKNPVIFIEHKSLFNKRSNVPKKKYEIQIGKGKILKKGSDVTVVAFSYMVEESLKAAKIQKNIKPEIIDMRSSFPLDINIIKRSVKKTKRLIVADIDWDFCGINSEIVSQILNDKSIKLKKKIIRIGLKHVPHPTSYTLENYLYPSYKDVLKSMKSLTSK